MSLSSIRTRLRDLGKRLDAVDLSITPKIKFLTLQPGASLPDGKTEDDYDYIVRLHDAEFPHPGAPDWSCR